MDYIIEDFIVLGIVSFIGWYIRQQFIKSTKKWDITEKRLVELEKTVDKLEYQVENLKENKYK